MYRKSTFRIHVLEMCIGNVKLLNMTFPNNRERGEKMKEELQPLPPQTCVETLAVLKQLARATRSLAELKGISLSIPNQHILINTLALQEAKASSAIENIITTQDELFKEGVFPERGLNAAAKEIARYAQALQAGYHLIQEHHLLTANHICEIQKIVDPKRPGFRKLPGTELKNAVTGAVVYTPPQHADMIVELMGNLERYINDPEMSDCDPLIKMAILHYQFESIHPFYDGNGRTGRIINVLYLVLQRLLDIPVLYLSRHIIDTKNEYYQRLQAVRDTGAWEAWILYMLEAVESTSLQTIQMINGIRDGMHATKTRIRGEFSFYSQDLINHLFTQPYTTIALLEKHLSVTRLTATKYLDQLTAAGLLRKEKLGRNNYYVNVALFDLLARSEG